MSRAWIREDSADYIALETLVDRTSLTAVIEALASIAYVKAEHLRSNWQDEQGAKVWARAGRFLSKLEIGAGL